MARQKLPHRRQRHHSLSPCGRSQSSVWEEEIKPLWEKYSKEAAQWVFIGRADADDLRLSAGDHRLLQFKDEAQEQQFRQLTEELAARNARTTALPIPTR